MDERNMRDAIASFKSSFNSFNDAVRVVRDGIYISSDKKKLTDEAKERQVLFAIKILKDPYERLKFAKANYSLENMELLLDEEIDLGYVKFIQDKGKCTSPVFEHWKKDCVSCAIDVLVKYVI